MEFLFQNSIFNLYNFNRIIRIAYDVYFVNYWKKSTYLVGSGSVRYEKLDPDPGQYTPTRSAAQA